jgi:hypothetical protein
MAESRTRKKGLVVSIIIILIALNIFQFAYFTWLRPPSVPLANSPLQVSDVTGSNRSGYVGQVLTVDGYYVAMPNNGSIITQNAGDYLQNRIIPAANYLKITGGIPDGFTVNDSGSRILLKGTIRIDPTSSNITDIAPISARIVERPAVPYYETVAPWLLVQSAFPRPTKYAVLISGGWDADHAYLRYWYDLQFMYYVLIDFLNYSSSHIIVIYKDGNPEFAGGMPVNYSCTYTNIQTAFSYLNSTMTSRDDLFIFTTNHGSPGYLCLWNHDLMSPSDFAYILAPIPCNHMVILMEQCYSGCFINALAATNRVIITAANSTESSWAASGTQGPFDEFSYQFTTAIRQETLNGYPVNPDNDNDGGVSMTEAFNYAFQMDSAPEHPQYSDNGNHFGSTGDQPLTSVGDSYFL